MVVVFTITEINYLVISLFYDLVQLILHFMFVILSSLAALIAMPPAERQQRRCLTKRHSPYFSRRPSHQIIFKQNILFKFRFSN